MKPKNYLWVIPYLTGYACCFILLGSNFAWWAFVVIAITTVVSSLIFNSYLRRHYAEKGAQ